MIFVVRHGQAAFGTDDYDRLTATGIEQARHLGEYFAKRQVRIDALLMGSLTRHRQTAEALASALRLHAPELLDDAVPEVFPALNEYDPRAVTEAHSGQSMQPDEAAEARDPTVVRQHFRMLREALIAWAEGKTEPAGMPTFANFQRDAMAVVEGARERFHQGVAVLVTSGGPIGAIVAGTLESPPRVAVELNLRIRNASVSEFVASAKRHHLVTFNSVAHLDSAPHLVTYA
jgi:broad specificity phosphatase PhoE